MLTTARTGLRRRTALLICSGLAAGVLAIGPAGPGASPVQESGPAASPAQAGSPCERATRKVAKAKRELTRAKSALRNAKTKRAKRKARERVRRARERLRRAQARRRARCRGAARVSVTGGYDHTRPGTPTAPSSVCARVSSPGQGGRSYEANLLMEAPSGSGSFSELRQATGTLDTAGREDVSFGIDRAGSNVRYQIDVAVITSSGAQVTGTTGPIATPVSPQKSRDCLAPHN